MHFKIEGEIKKCVCDENQEVDLIYKLRSEVKQISHLETLIKQKQHA